MSSSWLLDFSGPEKKKLEEALEPKNRIVWVMMHHLETCRTFGENLIFMLNQASKLNLGFLPSIYISIISLEQVVMIIAWNSLSSRSFTLYSPPMGHLNTFTPMIYASWWTFSCGNLLTSTKKANRHALPLYCYHRYFFDLLHSSYGIHIFVCFIPC